MYLSDGKCIVVEFDDMDQPIGEGQGVLAGFCGILATGCSLFPIHFNKWPDLPKSYFNGCFDRIIKEMSKRNAEIRKKQTVAHTGASKPNSIRRAEMMAESGQNPGRAQLYLATHKKEDGSYVNESAREICVLGKEHSGRVRCLGLGAISSKIFRQTRRLFGGINSSSCDNGSCSSQCEEKYNQIVNAHNQSQENYAQMMTAHHQMMNAFKTYMIMNEGTIPEQFAGIFVSPPPAAPSDAASGSISPMGVRRSSSDSNHNENH
ncbi:hypothetical protein A4A49_58540 [Nicotiana attenuata]|uniref:Uncharacterized protein n=1 Tax=Nicotiana attenuata TaxID=49451 RepID=A0A1J6HU29_NICAT|nr:hypothetical protein A4A49_58540 [Nicotiana attenuata]